MDANKVCDICDTEKPEVDHDDLKDVCLSCATPVSEVVSKVELSSVTVVIIPLQQSFLDETVDYVIDSLPPEDKKKLFSLGGIKDTVKWIIDGVIDILTVSRKGVM
jgi:hypothetical protein